MNRVCDHIFEGNTRIPLIDFRDGIHRRRVVGVVLAASTKEKNVRVVMVLRVARRA